MSAHLYAVRLDADQRARLEQLTHSGHAPARKLLHARVLLLSDRNQTGPHWTDERIAAALGLHRNTVARIRKRFALQGEAPALDRKQRAAPPVPPKVDGRVEAHLAAICCSKAPPGRQRWSLTLLVDELKRRGVVTTICRETVRRALKKMSCSLGASSAGASPSGTPRGSSARWKRSSTSTPPSTPRTSR